MSSSERKQRAAAKEIRFVYQYVGGRDIDDAQEQAPLIKAWVAGVPVPAGQPAAVHRHRLAERGPRGAHKYAPVGVAFPYHASEWPEDACARFLVFERIQNSEGAWTYEKAASSEVFLADLLAAARGTKVSADMRVQSYYMPTARDRRQPKLFEQKRHKGVLHVWRESAHPDVTWAPPTGLELVPRNYATLQAAAMLAVGRGMAPFNPRLMGRGAMRPTLRNEIDNVHAPLYEQETPIGLDGATFFSLTPTEAAAHITGRHDGIEGTKAYYAALLRQSLRRHDMSERDFVRAGEAYAGRAHGLTDHRMRIAGAVFATALTERVTMTEYVADMIVTGGAVHDKPVVESFDRVDDRTDEAGDFGGARSWDVGPAAALPPAGRRVASGGASDCEDGAKDAAVHFSTLTDRGVLADEHIQGEPLLVAARRIGQQYRAVAVLTSVLSRNLSDATAKQGAARRVTIGSPADMNVNVGAHMFTVLVPEATLKRNITLAMKAHHPNARPAPVGRRLAAPHPPARVDIGSYAPPERRLAPIGADVAAPRAVLKSGKALPVLLCEGTGMLHPLMVPWDGYEDPTDAVGRKVAVTRSILNQEAALRLQVGQGSSEIAASGRDVRPPPAMAKFKAMHAQKALVDDPDVRLVDTFYRTAAECYLIPTAAQISERIAGRAGTNRAGAPTLVGDRLIPVQVGGRHGVPGPVTWGVAISDILRSSAHVGFLPTPHPSPTETRIVQRVGQHIAPASSAWRLDTGRGEDGREVDPYIAAAQKWPAAFQRASGLPPPSSGQDKTRYIMAHAYGDPRKLADRDIAALGQWAKHNRYVVGAALDMEYTTYHLARVRFDALIDCGNTARESQAHVQELLRRAPKRPPLPMAEAKVRGRLSLVGALPQTQSAFHRAVVARFRKHYGGGGDESHHGALFAVRH